MHVRTGNGLLHHNMCCIWLLTHFSPVKVVPQLVCHTKVCSKICTYKHEHSSDPSYANTKQLASYATLL